MSDESREKTRGVIFAAVGVYLIYTAVKLIKDVASEEDPNVYKYIIPVIFIIVAVFFIVYGIKKVKAAASGKEEDELKKGGEDAAPIKEEDGAPGSRELPSSGERNENSSLSAGEDEAYPSDEEEERDIKAVILISRDTWTDPASLPEEIRDMDGYPAAYLVKEAAITAGVKKARYVIGYKNENVRAALADRGVTFTVQDEREGSGNALLCAADFIGKNCDVFVLGGNMTDLTGQALRGKLSVHRESGAGATCIKEPEGDAMGAYIFRSEAFLKYTRSRGSDTGALTIDEIAGAL